MGVDAGSAGVSSGLIRQGDVLLVPVDGLPRETLDVGSGRLVLADGEATGHAHVVEDERASLHSVGGRDGGRFLSVVGEEPVFLVHEEHDRLSVPPGVYEVRRQREYEPRRQVRFRWVAD
jgi:hypothetical protein